MVEKVKAEKKEEVKEEKIDFSKKSLIEKLNYIQVNIKAPKNQKNTFGKYNYRSQEDILEAVKPLLQITGTVVYPIDEIVELAGRTFLKATQVFTDGKDKIEVPSYAEMEISKKGMDASQLTGSTSSYARKYALNGLFAIDDNKDSDFTNTHGKEEKAEKKEDKPVEKNAEAKSEVAVFKGELTKLGVSNADEANKVLSKLTEGKQTDITKVVVDNALLLKTQKLTKDIVKEILEAK